MTALYLSTRGTAPEIASLASFVGAKRQPKVLLSFFYLKKMDKKDGGRARLDPLRRMLDSGAYSAFTLKKKIDIEALIAEINSGGWAEAAALDAIGDPETSARNAEYMKSKCPGVIPTFHFGEPWEFLAEYVRGYPKVGLGGLVPVRNKADRLAWLEECFARAYPKKFHIFGVMDRDTLMRFPFHSADSTSWEASALRFGNYAFADGQRLPFGRPGPRAAVGGETYLVPEVVKYMRLEDEVGARWREEFGRQGWS